MADYLKLKKSNCKNCYKCIRNCPVKSIRFADNQAHIIGADCILCGHCFVVCPQNAKEIRNDIPTAQKLLAGGAPVYASIAPSFVANYDHVTIRSLERALMQMGFAGVEETAIGATQVKKEYERLVREEHASVVITSCCHTVNLMIQKYYPKELGKLAHVLSPMLAHCADIKRRHPDAKTVFIGPCISKKAEAETYPGITDCVLTFEELSMWLNQERIVLEYLPDDAPDGRARLFPTTGGILRTMTEKYPGYEYMAIDGIENCMRFMDDLSRGGVENCFIEMSACAGSCVGGPAMIKTHASPVRDLLNVNRYAKETDFPVEQPDGARLKKDIEPEPLPSVCFSDMEIEEVLRKMGKTTPEQELNCGCCGYNTCRDKARAVLLGKAEYSMCLPYLKEKAESFSDTIVMNTPNAIIVLNESMEVQVINGAALKLMNIRAASNVMGEQVIRILDPKPFLDAYNYHKNTYDKRVYLAEYKKYVDQTVLYDRSFHIIICIMRDVTEETKQREGREELYRKTIETTDKVIEKQMRAVQEIASLLGESTAETKVAFTKLKESLGDE